jgi:hypothetical protein
MSLPETAVTDRLKAAPSGTRLFTWMDVGVIVYEVVLGWPAARLRPEREDESG